MKRMLMVLVACGCLGAGVFSASAVLEVTAGVQIHATADFYTPLTPHGAWIDVHSYGRCWRPVGVAADWRPYCDGHWEWTDSGWYWDSDEPWAWACYHYGRWDFDPDYGWYWIPDVEWAPAWVYWRVGTDHIGWAPCPPRGRSVVEANFVFVDTHHFHDPVRRSTVIINNPAIFGKTKLITKVSRTTRTVEGVGREKVIINNGPGVDRIEKATGSKFTAVSVRDVAARRTRGPEPQHVEKVAPPAREERPVEPRHEQEPEHVAPAPHEEHHEEAPRDRGEGDRQEDRHDEGGHGRDKDRH